MGRSTFNEPSPAQRDIGRQLHGVFCLGYTFARSVERSQLARQLEELRWRQEEQGLQIQAVFETIQQLIEASAEDSKKRFGFPTGTADPGLLE